MPFKIKVILFFIIESVLPSKKPRSRNKLKKSIMSRNNEKNIRKHNNKLQKEQDRVKRRNSSKEKLKS
jgi:hypothetical protein